MKFQNDFFPFLFPQLARFHFLSWRHLFTFLNASPRRYKVWLLSLSLELVMCH